MPPIPERLAAKAVFKTIGECRAAIVTIGINDDAKKMSEIFKSVGEGAEMIDLKPDSEQCSVLLKMTGKSEFPISFVKGDCVGGVKRLENYQKSGVLQEWFEQHQYDLIVLGGGSGGLAAAKQASSLGKKVACLDFVKPTPKGTTWGLGGTCVNVGCIPKKLMHHASLVGHFVEDAPKFGWQVAENAQHNWDKMKESVQNHIGSLNWGYRVQLREKEVTYLNSFATFVGSHKIKAVNKRGKEEMLTADKFILATGLRPRYIGVPGAKEYCITSDDLFSLPYCPGKTLCVGASYVSLECAGFLRGIGLDVTVMVRSILLRGFDQDMAERVGRHMETQNVKFIRGAVPTKFELLEEGTPGRIRVTSKTTDGKEIVDEYNTVVLAIGRDAVTDGMGLEVAGVERNPKNKKIVCNNEQSVSTPWVYAIGDVLDGKLELTPVAIQAGKLLAKRMFGAGTDLTDYENVPTTVFTPLEYGCCGLSEEKAIERYGESNIEVYHNVFMPLEFSVPGRVDINHCYAKLMRVVGLHIIAPNAGEVTQGYGMAFKFNATKADFDDLVGIHPTVAEIFTTMAVTKREQGELKATGC